MVSMAEEVSAEQRHEAVSDATAKTATETVVVDSKSNGEVKSDSNGINGTGLSPAGDQLNNTQSVIEALHNEWGFDIEELFKLSHKFYKDNESKAFHPSYDNRNKLVALTLQAKYGSYTGGKAQPAGALDIVGRDRRQAWADISTKSKEEAISDFVSLLNQLCPLFRPFIEAHKREREERERQATEQLNNEQRLKEQLEEEMQKKKLKEDEERRKFDEQKHAIQDALNRQTYPQFLAYAQQQYPTDQEQQGNLIRQLQEQHYEQYMEQMRQQQANYGQQLQASPVQYSSTEQQNGHGVQRSASSHDPEGAETAPLTSNQQISYRSVELAPAVSSGNHVNPVPVVLNHGQPGHTEQATDDDGEDLDEEEGPCATAQMWTRKEIAIFKDAIRNEGGDGIIKVGHGEIVTVRVPTHPEGSCIFWEFATDSYDIGFGLLFEWTKNPGNQVSVHVSESEDDDEEDDDSGSHAAPEYDPEKHIGLTNPSGLSPPGVLGADGKVNGSLSGLTELPTSVIVPIYRRDSHEEVFAGSHPYPGRGVYLLKFDNSYSLWRSKTLYYRVYYTR